MTNPNPFNGFGILILILSLLFVNGFSFGLDFAR